MDRGHGSPPPPPSSEVASSDEAPKRRPWTPPRLETGVDVLDDVRCYKFAMSEGHGPSGGLTGTS